MTKEELEMLSGATEILEGLKDQIRHGCARPESDRDVYLLLTDAVTNLHTAARIAERDLHLSRD